MLDHPLHLAAAFPRIGELPLLDLGEKRGGDKGLHEAGRLELIVLVALGAIFITGAWVMHWGIDISTNTGNPIMATADGIVIKVATDRYLGKNVTISHGNGFTTIYGHMSNFAVKPGQKVKRRDVIGYVGQTGKAAGPHVHYEVFKDGKRVDPRNFLLEE